MKRTFLFSFVIATIILYSCKREVETYMPVSKINEYVPLSVGKYITYRLDSTVFPQQGRSEEVHSYQEKQLISDKMLDNTGNDSYIIHRYIRDINGTQDWQFAGTFNISTDSNKVEVMEHNLRFIKLANPISFNTNWKGNRYLPENPYYPKFNFDLGNQLSLWEYNYSNINQLLELNKKIYRNVLTMTAAEDSIPITPDQVYAYKTISKDQYAKNIGLIYQRLAIWEYQQNIGGTPYKIGFEVKRSIIDHN